MAWVNFQFPTIAAVSIPAGGEIVCGFDKFLAENCEVTSTNPLRVKMHAPVGVTLGSKLFFINFCIFHHLSILGSTSNT